MAKRASTKAAKKAATIPEAKGQAGSPSPEPGAADSPAVPGGPAAIDAAGKDAPEGDRPGAGADAPKGVAAAKAAGEVTPPSPAVPAGSLRIVAKRNGFRRGGLSHPAEPTIHLPGSLSLEQLLAILREPMLKVEGVATDGTTISGEQLIAELTKEEGK
jgi:hypothetical protein